MQQVQPADAAVLFCQYVPACSDTAIRVLTPVDSSSIKCKVAINLSLGLTSMME